MWPVRRTIDPSKMVIVVVGDAAKIKDELETIAPVTVVSPDVQKTPEKSQTLDPVTADET